jgi:hypothetical protein
MVLHMKIYVIKNLFVHLKAKRFQLMKPFTNYQVLKIVIKASSQYFDHIIGKFSIKI